MEQKCRAGEMANVLGYGNFVSTRPPCGCPGAVSIGVPGLFPRAQWYLHMHQILTDIEIQAQPVTIWSVLTDFPAYPDWNPFIRQIVGAPAVGTRLTVSLKPPNGRAVTFHPLVLECIENRILRWQGRFLVPRLLDGEHFFRIESPAPGRVTFTHGERFSGLLVPLCRKLLDGPVRAGFMEMNQALKSRAEHDRPASQ